MRSSQLAVGMDGSDPVFPQDIINNILIRLPVKSLIRFQCVCKHWKILFKTPSFIAEHLHHSSHQNLSLLLQDFGQSEPFRLHLLDREMQVAEVPNDPFMDSVRARVWTIGSCHGLLCLRVATFPISFLVWNPATREVRQVLRAVNYYKDDHFSVGFGFSPTVHDYEIVKIRVSGNDHLVKQVEMYSLSTGLWREIEFADLDGIAIYSDGVAINGAIFWIGRKPGVEENEDYINLIVSFDIAMEVFKLIPTPPSLSSVGSTPFPKYLTAYENKLAMLCGPLSGDKRSSLIDLWVMEEGTGANGKGWSWTKKYTGNPYPYFLLFPETIWKNEIACNICRPIVYRPTDQEENDERDIVMFNPTTNQVKKFGFRKSPVHYRIFSYAESLVPIGNIHT